MPRRETRLVDERRVVAMKLKIDELGGVRALVEHVVRTRSAKPARGSGLSADMACIGTPSAVCVDNGVRAAR